MSDTPRTDAEKQRFILEDNLDDTEMVPSKFCETLEKELNAANARIKKLEGVILELTAAGNCVQSDKNSILSILKNMGCYPHAMGCAIGDRSTERWINAKEWDRKEKGLA